MFIQGGLGSAMLGIGFQPANSPDLNPIENVFSLMKRSVQKDAPSNEQDLRRSIERAWETLTPDVLRSLFKSMPTRMKEVIANKGERIAY